MTVPKTLANQKMSRRTEGVAFTPLPHFARRLFELVHVHVCMCVCMFMFYVRTCGNMIRARVVGAIGQRPLNCAVSSPDMTR